MRKYNLAHLLPLFVCNLPPSICFSPASWLLFFFLASLSPICIPLCLVFWPVPKLIIPCKYNNKKIKFSTNPFSNAKRVYKTPHVSKAIITLTGTSVQHETSSAFMCFLICRTEQIIKKWATFFRTLLSSALSCLGFEYLL